MIPQIVGLALIPPTMLGFQRKTPIIGDYLADARIAILDIAHKEIKSKLKMKDIDGDTARTALTNIRFLRKANDDGWISVDEYAKLLQVLQLVSVTGSKTALDAINKRLTGIRARAKDWAQESYDEIATGVGKSIEELKKRFKKKK